MKIRNMVCVLLCFAMVLLIGGCASKPKDSKPNPDYSAYAFAGDQWYRDTEGDLETLCFRTNGEFRYSCACGSPVDDADLVESYTYDDATKTFTLHYCEEVDGCITQIKLISCDAEKLELDFEGEIRTFWKEEPQPDTTEDISASYTVDLTKISPMILEHSQSEVITAAKAVIHSFLQYETQTQIQVSGNTQRFLNDMVYVIHCTCPMFGAFTDFSEMTSYDQTSGTVSWNYVVDREEFDRKLEEFHAVAENLLSTVDQNDTQTMRALVLYHALIADLQYDESLLGENYNLLTPEEANLKSSPYWTLVEKSGICTNIAQAYLFLCTQADIPCGTVLHTGGSGMHMWNVLEIDGLYYYCDPTWDADSSGKYFGMTAADRGDWAGGYSDQEGTMLGVTIPEVYEINDSRFAELRNKLPVELSDIRIDQEEQTITFVGYAYEFCFSCQ
ncbi:MAG: hypothetical protein IKW10_06480 [Oscillospiraceae bacterium]|nr:hypothetical protein [Oscillospiraceae bacterium]